MSILKWGFNIFLIIWILKLHLISCSTSFSSDPSNQQQLDRVLKLPGQNFNVSFAHYAGYVTVNEESGRSLFYWFFEADVNPSSTPLVLWLNGGPGCSSVGLGMAEEIGPLHIEKDGKTLYLNPFSWNKVASILFLDSPVGVGYSYSNTSSDLLSNGDKRTAAENLIFLRKWFERFPQYRGRDFYITGESYAGHYVPQLSQAIMEHNGKYREEIINLKGFMVGNAAIDSYHDYLGLFQFWYSIGLISGQTYKQLNVLCDFESFVAHIPEQCEKVLEIADEEIGNIDTYNVYSPVCTPNFSRMNHLWRRNSTKAIDPCTKQHSTIYFSLPDVQNALHVRKQNSTWKWQVCRYYNSVTVKQNWMDSPISVLNIYSELIHSGLRIWIFSGDTDAEIPITSTRYTIDALKLPILSPYRPWYNDGQVGGRTQEYEGLSFVTVRGAGHKVPLYKPRLALTLIESFLSGQSMPKHDLENEKSKVLSEKALDKWWVFKEG